MPKYISYLIYALMISIGLLAMYSILNSGNPNSLLRPFSPDPVSDVYIAMVSSVSVFILGFVVFHARDREGFQRLIEINSERIRKFRKKGKSDEEIAVSILEAMGIQKGYRYKMSRKKLAAYLSEFE